MNWKALLFISLLGLGAFQHFNHRAVLHGPGVMAPDEPFQKRLDVANKHTINAFEVVPLATFSIKARVLAAKNYHTGREAKLSPVDFVLGWGRMSDEAVLRQIKISQGNRFYFWHVEAFPIPREEIETHSANMHMIPADRLIEKALRAVRVGQVIKLNGYLVEAKAADGWYWKSSLSRTDTGNGACEVMLVKSIEVTNS